MSLADQIARRCRMIKPLGEAMHDRVFQAFVMQRSGIDEGGKLRLAANDVFRFVAHAIPDRIERGKLAALRIDLMHCHGLLPAIR